MACDSPFYVKTKDGEQIVPVMCGRCPQCKLRRVNGWVFRCVQENRRSTASHFVTLTYATHSCPISRNTLMTLRKKHLQNFFKRLRKLCPDSKIKYYACGEYGSQFARPHYHAIIFNVDDPQKYVDAWTLKGRQIGKVDIGEVTSDSIAYTMKYIDKPTKVPMHSRDDREKEFAVMSKHLGSNYVTPEIIKYHTEDLSRLYVTKFDGYQVAMPRYYRKLIFDKDQMAEQLPLIWAAMSERLADKRKEWERYYIDTSTGEARMSFEAWLDSQRQARYSSFYSKQLKRDF